LLARQRQRITVTLEDTAVALATAPIATAPEISTPITSVGVAFTTGVTAGVTTATFSTTPTAVSGTTIIDETDIGVIVMIPEALWAA